MPAQQADRQGEQPLQTWRQIGAFVGRDERTAKRWETMRGLPVHRIPGGGSAAVFAYPSELTRWLKGESDEAAEPAPPAPPDPTPPEAVDPSPSPAVPPPWWRRRPTTAIVAAIALLIGTAWLGWTHGRAGPRATPPSLAAEQAYVAATLDWQKRTPASLARAEQEYRTAIARDPGYAAAYAGLANTYNLLREYTGMPDAQAYPLARANALRAIALDDSLASGHAALGFAEYWGYWNVERARTEFARAVELDPECVTARLWYATFLSNLGEETAALREVDAARALEPRTFAIETARALIVALGGRREEGVRTLRALSASAPRSTDPLVLIAGLSLKARDYPAFLDADKRLAAIGGDPGTVAAAAAADEAFRHGGPRALLARLIADAQAAYVDNRETAFQLAVLYAQAGDQEHALAMLQTSADRRESTFLQITNPANFRELRHSPAFKAMLGRLKALD